MEDEQKQPSPFEQAVVKIRARYAWYTDRSIEMLPYSEVYKIVDRILDELNAAYMQTVAAICANYTLMVYKDMDKAREISTLLEEANSTINLLKEHLKAANNTIKFEKRTRLELPRDANGRRIYPYSKLERWGAIEDFWYCNGYWQVRGHDTSAPWLPAEKVVVCEDDEDGSDQATPESKRPRGCSSRSEAEQVVRAYCLGKLTAKALVDLLFPYDSDSWEA